MKYPSLIPRFASPPQFLESKKLRIINLQQDNKRASYNEGSDSDVGPDAGAMMDDEDSEDDGDYGAEDAKREQEDESSDSGSDSDSDMSEGSDVAEARKRARGENVSAPAKKRAKKAPASGTPKKRGGKKKKKDPNAPKVSGSVLRTNKYLLNMLTKRSIMPSLTVSNALQILTHLQSDLLHSSQRAMSAFMFFSNAKRAEVKDANPGIAFGEIATKISGMWKAEGLDKGPYEEMAAKDKARYEKAMETYVPPEPGSDDSDDEPASKKKGR